MRSIVEIVTPAESELLTTLERVKAELQITTDANDEIQEAKIAEASSDIQAAVGKRLPREDVKETFWHDDDRHLQRVVAMNSEQTVAGIPVTTFEIIISPTQIKAAQWPGGMPPLLPPFDVDQSIPRAGTTDKVLMRGLPPKDVFFVDPVMPDGEVVRINMKVKG